MAVDYEIVIIGTGFSGVNMSIELVKNGFNSFLVLEKSDRIGGVWRDNIYPGCSCDIRAPLYSIKSEPNPNWSSNFPPQEEILKYLESLVNKYQLNQHIEFKTEVKELTFLELEGVWEITSTSKSYRAKSVILATGPQRLAYIPKISGLETFKNRSFHSVKWDNSIDLAGLNVGVIGTGASSIQIVPNICDKVSQLVLFQRSAPWILPRMKRQTLKVERWIFKQFPSTLVMKRTLIFWIQELIGSAFFGNKFLQYILTKIALFKLWIEVRDPNLRSKLRPNYAIGCKRILVSDDYFQAIRKANVVLETAQIERITTNSILTKSKDYSLDLIIFGTGFTVADLKNYIEIKGLGGISLKEKWQFSGAEAFLGTNINGFPNLCYLLGPNSGLSHSSVLHSMESQVKYVLQYLNEIRMLKSNGYIDVKKDIQESYNQHIQSLLKGTIWASGCQSWFLNKAKKNTVIYPGNLSAFRKVTRKLDLKHYHICEPIPLTQTKLT